MDDRLMQTSLGHCDDTAMGNRSTPGDVPALSRSFGFAGISTMDINMLPAAIRSHRQANSLSMEDPIVNWYYNSSDAPWTPKGLASPGPVERNSFHLNGVSIGNHIPVVFAGQYRENYLPSECETTPLSAVNQSDSGYGSNGNKRSIAAGSVYEEPMDRSPDVPQNLQVNFNGLGLQGFEEPPENAAQKSWPQQERQSPVTQRPNSQAEKKLICGTCEKPMKTNSELKKHEQRHSKPFTCQEPGCPRTHGFSTSNDLDRHKRSCHPDVDSMGTRYRCLLGACRNKTKIWPRADNFRAHLKRLHQHVGSDDDDLERFVYNNLPSQEVVLPDLASTQAPPMDYNSFQYSPEAPYPAAFWQSGSSQSPLLDLSSSSSGDRDSHRSQVGDGSSSVDLIPAADYPQKCDIRTPSGGHEMDTNEGAMTENGNLQRPNGPPIFGPSEDQDCFSSSSAQGNKSISEEHPVPPTLLHTPNNEASSLIDSKSNRGDVSASSYRGLSGGKPLNNIAYTAAIQENSMSVKRTGESIEDDKRLAEADTKQALADIKGLLDMDDPAGLRKFVEALDQRGLLANLGYRKGESPSATENGPSDSQASVRSEPQNPCSKCNKRFARPCELKKHLKRHEKPYGCTFPSCGGKFGSKNDWKRHENSQHFLLEVWKCDAASNTGASEVCNKVHHRREQFRQHLTNIHKFSSKVTEKKLDVCRIGRNCEARFWCGFCEKIIEIKTKGIDAWTERFNHIDDHFSGRNDLTKKQIDDWKGVDAEAPVGDGSASDSDESSSPPSASAQVSLYATRPHQTSHNGSKRKSDDADDGRDGKRCRPMSRILRCCRCGEGNIKNTSLHCVSNTCQHAFCADCC